MKKKRLIQKQSENLQARLEKRASARDRIILAFVALALGGLVGESARAEGFEPIRSVAYTPVEPLILGSDFELNDDESGEESDDLRDDRLGFQDESDDVLSSAPSPALLGVGGETAPEPRAVEPSNLSSSNPRSARPRTSRLYNSPMTIPGASNRTSRRPGTISSAVTPFANANSAARATQGGARANASTQTARSNASVGSSLASARPTSVVMPNVPRTSSIVATSEASARQTDALRAPVERGYADQTADQTNETTNASIVKMESLEEAIQIALAQSRTQRALAHKRSAAQATAEAASSLRNPKINNTTTYVGLLNKPTTVSDIDLSGPLSELAPLLPPESAAALVNFPTTYEIATPLTDRNFVTSVTSVSIPLYLGGRIRALEEQTRAMTQAVAAGEEVGEQCVKLETTEAYFLVLRARQLHKVALEAVESAQEHLNDSQKMYDVGMLTKNVVLAAQVASSEAKQLELKVANAQSLAEAAYNRVLWRPLDSAVEIEDVELGGSLGDLEELTEFAMRSRAEIQVLNAEARALQAQVKVARADVLPQVAAVGAYSYFQNSHMADNSNATAAVGVTWTPFDGGTSRARRNAAQQNAMAVVRAREEAESAIRLQVRQAFLAENEARERLEVARVAAEQAEENYRVVTRGFQEGVLNHTEVLDASTMRTGAKSSLTNAKYDAILATQRLRRAVGAL